MPRPSARVLRGQRRAALTSRPPLWLSWTSQTSTEPSARLWVTVSAERGGKQISASPGYCESHWREAPRLAMPWVISSSLRRVGVTWASRGRHVGVVWGTHGATWGHMGSREITWVVRGCAGLCGVVRGCAGLCG
eukprot:1853353-Prymnesium_polylepis.1